MPNVLLPTLRKIGSVLLAAACLLTYINFIVFWAISFYVGDALNGKQEGDRYYLGSHGRYTEVSRRAFEYSAIQARSVEITFPLAFLVTIIAAQRSNRPPSVISHGKSRSSGGEA